VVLHGSATTSVAGPPSGPGSHAPPFYPQGPSQRSSPVACIPCCRWTTASSSLQPALPPLTRSSLRRCLQRHGISRLPETEDDQPIKKRFESYPIGCFHVDTADVQTAEGTLERFMAADRTPRFAPTEVHPKACKVTAAQFLRHAIGAVPHALHTVLTGSGTRFTDRSSDRYAFQCIFGRVCAEQGTRHRRAEIQHPWTDGQVERMNRTLGQAGVECLHPGDHAQLRQHWGNSIDAYDFGRRPLRP